MFNPFVMLWKKSRGGSEREKCLHFKSHAIWYFYVFFMLDSDDVHGISRLAQMKCLRLLLFYELSGATVQAICTSNGRTSCFSALDDKNSLANSAEAAKP